MKYRAKGSSCLSKLEGEWSFPLANQEEKEEDQRQQLGRQKQDAGTDVSRLASFIALIEASNSDAERIKLCKSPHPHHLGLLSAN